MAASGGYVVIALFAVIGLLVSLVWIGATNGQGSRQVVFSDSHPACLPESTVCSHRERHEAAYAVRRAAAEVQYARGQPCHVANGDESLYAVDHRASYTKGLLHDNVTGEVVASYYNTYIAGLASQTAAGINGIALAPGAQRKLDNPQGGLAFDLIGNDAWSLTQQPAPLFDSPEAGAELIQLYWMALLRDVPFEQYASNGLAASAAAELGVPVASLFRGTAPGCNVGPYISQFLLLPCSYGANEIDQTIAPPQAGEDYMTTFAHYLNIQNGRNTLETVSPFGTTRRYMSNGRDLAAWVPKAP